MHISVSLSFVCHYKKERLISNPNKPKRERNQRRNMGCFGGKKKSYDKQYEKDIRGLAITIRLLQEEIKAIMCEREKESRAYERDMMASAFKEAQWKQQKKEFKSQVKRLRRVLKDKEEKIKRENGLAVEKNDEQQWLFSSQGNDCMLDEQQWRDEAVEKWKKLYHIIKIELDDLIQRTHSSGNGLYWKGEEEGMIEELKMEVKAKEKTIEALKERIAKVEHEEYKKARELDIMRQSLRIISSTKCAPSCRKL